MNLSNKWAWVAALLLSTCTVACSDSDDPEQDPMELPADTYPVEFTASIQQLARATAADNTWSGSEVITVQSVLTDGNAAPDWASAQTVNYTPANGKLVAANPIYWNRKDEVRAVRAWYLGNGTTSSSVPASWNVGADQSAGHQAADLLYATGTAKHEGANALVFHHQTAKAIVNVKRQGNAVTHVTVTGVTLGDANLAVEGSFTAPEAGATVGSWTPGNAASTITPLTLTPAAGYEASCSALIIPQSIAGKTFLTVALSDGKTLSWTATDATDLVAGREYTYDVTLSHDLSAIEVKVVTGATWGNGENKDIASEGDTAGYGEVKVGDYYYSDGSWSDGGFIAYNTTGNGSITWTSPKPAPVNVNPVTGKTRKVIGVVYSTDLTRMGDAEKAALAAKGVTPHGLVMATKTIPSTQWDANANDETTIGIANVAGSVGDPLYPYANAQISGYSVCSAINQNRTVGQNYLAIADAMDMEAPNLSTGWYVPATGQWFDMLRNFTGMNFSDTADFYFIANDYDVEDGVHFDWQIDFNPIVAAKYKNENFITNINQSLSAIDANLKDDIQPGANIITSTMMNAGNMYYINILPKFITCKAVSKNYWIQMRPVLAF